MAELEDAVDRWEQANREIRTVLRDRDHRVFDRDSWDAIWARQIQAGREVRQLLRDEDALPD